MNFKSLTRWPGGLILGLACCYYAAGQGICVISEKKLQRLEASVVLPNKLPIPGAAIDLYRRDNVRDVIARSVTDDTGRFQIPDIRDGRYYLVASYPSLVELWVPVRIASKGRHSSNRHLVIVLNGMIDKPCGDGDAYFDSNSF